MKTVIVSKIDNKNLTLQLYIQEPGTYFMRVT